MASILVVDDDRVAREILAAALESGGHTVIQASDGHEALARLWRGEPVDAVATDILMPDMDGLELIQAIRRHRPRLPIIALSSGSHRFPLAFLPMAQALGAEAVLTKPYAPSALLETLEQLLKRHAAGPQRPAMAQ